MPADYWVAVTGGTVIDGTGQAPRRADVLISDGRITEVGTFQQDRVPRGAELRTIDATGKTVMPGLIDAHCHMTYGESRTEEEIDLYTSAELRTLRAAWNAAKVLRAGVTSISQPGGSYFIGVGLREAINEGFVLGPRMSSAGRYMTTSNGLTDWYPDSVGVPQGSIGILTNTLPAMIDEIRQQAKAGVDFIKVADSPMGDYQAFTDDELKAMADLAHQLGKRITIHARGSAEVRAAVAAGFDWIMHGNIMSDETIEALADSQIPLVPTLTLLANSTTYGAEVRVPKGLYNAWARMMDDTGDALHRAHQAGVRFVTGTDSGFSLTPYGEWHARELSLLMDYAGLSASEAIQAATANAAVTTNHAGQVGQLVPQMIADLIVVDGDPLTDITVLEDRRNIVEVISGGTIVEFDEAMIARRWPHERGLTYSELDLFYRPGSGRAAPGPDDGLRERGLTDTDHDLAADIGRREREARLDA
jgi:imidazolonepropionase-like amidohydrolase